jgi:hypothetical protein
MGEIDDEISQNAGYLNNSNSFWGSYGFSDEGSSR